MPKKIEVVPNAFDPTDDKLYSRSLSTSLVPSFIPEKSSPSGTPKSSDAHSPSQLRRINSVSVLDCRTFESVLEQIVVVLIYSIHPSLTASSWFHLSQSESMFSTKILQVQVPNLANMISIGICAMDKKAHSKPMKEILRRLTSHMEFEAVFFGDDTILNKPVEEWPICQILMSWHSDGFPLQKVSFHKNSSSFSFPYLFP